VIEEIDLNDVEVPAWTRGWGSPTILVNGADVMGEMPPGAGTTSS